jgi:dihydroceramidase
MCLLVAQGYYHYLQDPTFHQNAYAILTAVVLLRSMYVMELNIRPSWKAKKTAVERRRSSLGGGPTNGRTPEQEAEQMRRDERDERILRLMWTMVALGLGIFLGGFVIWNLDNMFCPTLRRWRRTLGLPWGVLLEGHGWWYVSVSQRQSDLKYSNVAGTS